jgi:hypothetical protein
MEFDFNSIGKKLADCMQLTYLGRHAALIKINGGEKLKANRVAKTECILLLKWFECSNFRPATHKASDDMPHPPDLLVVTVEMLISRHNFNFPHTSLEV